VIKIELLPETIPGYWEIRGYPDEARIETGEVLDANPGVWRRIPGGEVVEFLD